MPKRDVAPNGAPCWIDLFSSDTDASRAFYGELFGWKSEDAGPDYGGYITFSKDDLPIAGCMHNDGQDGMPDSWSVYLATDDAQAIADATVPNGGQVIVPPMPVGELGTMAILVDAGGAAIGAWQPGEHKGFGMWAETDTPAWFELHTRDHDASVAFYRTVFGWDAHAMSDTPDFTYTTLGKGEGQLAGIMDASAFLPEGVPSHWFIYFGTDDTDASVKHTVELGGSVVMPAEDTPYGRMATAADPTGAMFKLVQSTDT